MSTQLNIYQTARDLKFTIRRSFGLNPLVVDTVRHTLIKVFLRKDDVIPKGLPRKIGNFTVTYRRRNESKK